VGLRSSFAIVCVIGIDNWRLWNYSSTLEAQSGS
jgi:hypothetical protein